MKWKFIIGSIDFVEREIERYETEVADSHSLRVIDSGMTDSTYYVLIRYKEKRTMGQFSG